MAANRTTDVDAGSFLSISSAVSSALYGNSRGHSWPVVVPSPGLREAMRRELFLWEWEQMVPKVARDAECRCRDNCPGWGQLCGFRHAKRSHRMQRCGQHSSAQRNTGAGANTYRNSERSPEHKRDC